ncbi:hypothetical protein FNL39_1072 [Nocardia caishijiensis]|uniref:Uncharacterized protein n=1 Tax=Nocardia caishijiensis TaxID=184756 RepID=A0ABQ6YHY7_9NOCA|nr:hypothetical protein FNL39_1072 [Nocardia caishijiensis]
MLENKNRLAILGASFDGLVDGYVGQNVHG